MFDFSVSGRKTSGFFSENSPLFSFSLFNCKNVAEPSFIMYLKSYLRNIGFEEKKVIIFHISQDLTNNKEQPLAKINIL